MEMATMFGVFVGMALARCGEVDAGLDTSSPQEWMRFLRPRVGFSWRSAAMCEACLGEWGDAGIYEGKWSLWVKQRIPVSNYCTAPATTPTYVGTLVLRKSRWKKRGLPKRRAFLPLLQSVAEKASLLSTTVNRRHSYNYQSTYLASFVTMETR